MSTTAGTRGGYAREEQVISEGVAIELPVASVVARLASRLIDLLVMAVVLGLLLIAAVLTALDFSGAVQRTVALLCVIGVVVVFPATLETVTRGKSIGRYAMGLRIVRDDGGPVTGRQALLRALTAVVELTTTAGGASLVCAVATQRAKRIGDLAAGTYAISERHVLRIPAASMAHPVLAAWTRQADIGVLPTGLAMAVRQFLSRAQSFTPQARDQIGRQLLVDTLEHVSPAPPPGWHAEYVLAAILADRRRRDTERLARDELLRARLLGPQPTR
ncbi:MAG: RDD family protein [Nostocoides sp.]